MRAYSSMPTSEFVNQLRDIAIRAGAGPLVMYQLDSIVDGPSEEEIETREETASKEGEEYANKEWRRAQSNAISALDGVEMPDEAYKAVLAIIENMDPTS